MLLLNQDANTGGGSSLTPAAQATDGQVQDANINQDPSLEVGEEGAKAGEGTKEETIEDVVNKLKEKYSKAPEADSASPADKKADSAKDSSVLKENETPEQKAERESKEKAEALKTPDDKLPFHNHPRFKQVIEERNTLDGKVKELAPRAERMQIVEDFCAKNNIPPQDYDESIRLAALVRNNPAEALVKLKGIVQALEIQTGTTLPPDLQMQVDEGKLSLTHAQEMSKLRLQSSRSEQQAKLTQQTAAERVQQQLVSSLDAWTRNKIQSDPSYKPKQQGQPEGKYELVQDKFLSLWQKAPPGSVEAAVALAERAYNEVHAFIERTLPKPAQRRPLSPKSSETPTEKPVDISKPGWAKKIALRQLAKVN